FEQAPGGQARLSEQRQTVALAQGGRLAVDPQGVGEPRGGEEVEGPPTLPIEPPANFRERRAAPLQAREQRPPPVQRLAGGGRRAPGAEHETPRARDGPDRVAQRGLAAEIGPERVVGGPEETAEGPRSLVGAGAEALPPRQQHVDGDASLP